ncbi:hypothetical protein ILFOPFJJ_06624 [Ensifer psoraleae]|uniref:diguanylate cyclase domain-containing protein n=1 Tax=Sinorhizobium psoraleae TaxID=520838 RepID=UPI001567DE63|nr:GGDEF domain-containing protein [Sinorhizobium psoraleae]NRP75701.1 hypothetical protein [Sinorhizobium psoraleae]
MQLMPVADPAGEELQVLDVLVKAMQRSGIEATADSCSLLLREISRERPTLLQALVKLNGSLSDGIDRTPSSQELNRNLDDESVGRLLRFVETSKRTVDGLLSAATRDISRLHSIAQQVSAPNLPNSRSVHLALSELTRSARKNHALLQQTNRTLELVRRELGGSPPLETVDPVTGLPNYAAFRSRLNDVFGHPTPRPATVLMLIELGALNAVTTEIGRGAAERVLRRFCLIVRRSVKKSDSFARVGFQQFALLFEGVTADVVKSIADRICDAINAKLNPKSNDILDLLCVTVGIFADRQDVKSVDDYLVKVQEKLVAARLQGKSRISPS